jgi:hypothetical protein
MQGEPLNVITWNDSFIIYYVKNSLKKKYAWFQGDTWLFVSCISYEICHRYRAQL